MQIKSEKKYRKLAFLLLKHAKIKKKLYLCTLFVAGYFLTRVYNNQLSYRKCSENLRSPQKLKIVWGPR